MLALYHCHDARSFRPLWTLEEMGLPYELKMLPFPPRARVPDYLTVNPLGTVPTFLDGAMRMTRIGGDLPVSSDPLRPEPFGGGERPAAAFWSYLNWLYFGEATLTFPQTIVLRYSLLETPERRSAQVAEDYTRWFLGACAVLTRSSPSNRRSVPLCFTVADISVGFALMLAEFIGLDVKFSPAVAAYWQSLKEREGFRRAIAKQDGDPNVQSVREFLKQS